MDLFWHRQDLRVADNIGLAAAARRSDDEVAPVFVFDDDVLAHASDVRVRRLLDGLAALQDTYRSLGADLLAARGDPADVLPALAAALDADRVVWNRDYSGLARERDAGVRRALNEADIAREAHHDAVIHEPDAIRTNAGDPYSVFTYFGRKWVDRPADDPVSSPDPEALAAPDALEAVVGSDVLKEAVDSDALTEAGGSGSRRETVENGGTGGAGDGATVGAPSVRVGELPAPADLGFAEPDADLDAAGTAAARERLDRFLAEDVFRYAADRDYPSRDCPSRLSAHLTYGEIGIRETYAATEAALAAAEAGDVPESVAASDADPVEGVEEFRDQLAWREFYTQVLYHNPEVVTENYKSYEEGIEWRDDPAEIAAWKRGETGYPIVDAGMRQLLAEGYMHNRVRMIVASFLTKDLLADWRHGYDHFREHLADHDTANDNGGWQWAASTGTDAQPYFRIFNPMTQGERYDPDAEYITEHVPELRGVDPDLIHEWHDLMAVQRANAAPKYPDPIVDHSQRREQALAMYKRARGEDPEA